MQADFWIALLTAAAILSVIIACSICLAMWVWDRLR